MNDFSNRKRADHPGAWWFRVTIAVCDGGLILTLILAALAWVLGSLHTTWGPVKFTIHWRKALLTWPVLMLVLSAVLRAVSGARGSRQTGLLERRAWARLTLGLSAVFVFFLGVEQVLEWTGFEAHVPPIRIQGPPDEPDDVGLDNRFAKDAYLMWKFSPGGEFKGWRINRLGFREREINPAKPAGLVRVICMGDSCTADGGPPYAGCLHALLTNAPPTPDAWEAFNMGVYGYSAVQGRRLFELKGRDLRPDIVTLYFGWNDHWLCGFRPDSSNMALATTPVRAALLELLTRKRIGQLLLHVATRGRNVTLLKRHGRLPEDIEQSYRVPPEEYRYTLRRFVRDIRRAGAIPLLITAPRAAEVSGVFVANGQARSLEELHTSHDHYVEITREVARETDTPLLDLAEKLADPSLRSLFGRDGVHFTQEGLWRVAQELYAKIVELTRSPAWKKRRTPTGLR